MIITIDTNRFKKEQTEKPNMFYTECSASKIILPTISKFCIHCNTHIENNQMKEMASKL